MGVSFQQIRKGLPWYLKFSIKIVRGCLPIPYGVFASLGLFRHGKMDNPDYAILTFNTHFPKPQDIPEAPFGFLEIGPGDSLASGIIASSKGAKVSYLVDSGDYMTKEVLKYVPLIEKLFGVGTVTNKKIQTIDDIKRIFNIVQLTNGVHSLKEIPDHSIDASFSNACLEHVARNEMDLLFKELKRICKKGSVSSHFIDFKDHLQYSLNNLRFSRNFWEKDLIKKSGIYTNRLRFSDIQKSIEKAGFHCEISSLGQWESMPIPMSKLNAEFKSYGQDDLLIKEALVRLV